jgi:hypothetical protein
VLGRDIRRFYEPTIEKPVFEQILRYYLWGGKELYQIRQQMRERIGSGSSGAGELPPWDSLVSFTGLIVDAPQIVGMRSCVPRNFDPRGNSPPRGPRQDRHRTTQI